MFGILLIDKPAGWTSHDVCQKLKRLLNERRIGHTGTLDPMATGLMLVAVGEATKFVKYLSEEDKTYDAEITFGIATDTQDITGEVVATDDASALSETDVDRAIATFRGTILQIPPAFSAIKIDGKKLYEYAHAGKTAPTPEARTVTVHDFFRSGPMSSAIDGKKTLDVTCKVSKGTYVRTLAHDLGKALGIPATLSKLRRTHIGVHDVRNASTIESLDPRNPPFLSWNQTTNLPDIVVDDDVKRQIAHGAMLPLSLFPAPVDTMVYDREGRLLAVYCFDPERQLMRVSVICNECKAS